MPTFDTLNIHPYVKDGYLHIDVVRLTHDISGEEGEDAREVHVDSFKVKLEGVEEQNILIDTGAGFETFS